MPGYCLKSARYKVVAIPIWRKLFRHAVCLARALAFESAGKSMAAKMAIMAMTTSNSISVNASSSRFGYFAAKVGCCAARDGWQGDVGGQAGEGLGTWRRVRELATGVVVA